MLFWKSQVYLLTLLVAFILVSPAGVAGVPREVLSNVFGLLVNITEATLEALEELLL